VTAEIHLLCSELFTSLKLSENVILKLLARHNTAPVSNNWLVGAIKDHLLMSIAVPEGGTFLVHVGH
jgi:hypothetical protein